ncbi:hypothetical protein KIN20_029294 [Parelaphostrongylus tenuis]|uniref:ARID domain-containing protein n=1 Tax=Parelaphostrongylus tenuis TaxID=148309 RepID=A0AAD5R2E5_PARTN|nr:hypothetical protein KIN20_029294 [Parelaphostrongylus tenuis]
MNAQLRTAIDRANLFLSKGTLPSNWTSKDIYAENIPRKKSGAKNDSSKVNKKNENNESGKRDDESKKKKTNEKKVESSSSSSDDSEEEYGEERDLFVAQLYKFQEERGTPINRAPILGGKDIDLYRFYRVVQDYGGLQASHSESKVEKGFMQTSLGGLSWCNTSHCSKGLYKVSGTFQFLLQKVGERRLIRPAELLNQSTKKRKPSTVEAKEKTTKKGKEKVEDRESKEASRDPEPSGHAERSLCSPASTSVEAVKKVDKEEDERKADRSAKEDEGKEKIDRKEKKERSKDKEKDEKQKEKDDKGKAKREDKAKEVDNIAPDQPMASCEIKQEDEPSTSTAAKLALK